MKPYRTRLTLILIIIFILVLAAPHALAEGGVVVRPYWTFRTEAAHG